MIGLESLIEVKKLLAEFSSEQPIHYISVNEFGFNEILKFMPSEQLNGGWLLAGGIRVKLNINQVEPFKIHYWETRK